MQTSKIKTGDIYAVKVAGEYVRFRVTEIVRTSTLSGHHASIKGELIDRAEGSNPGASRVFEPSEVLGPYHQFAALAERKRKEDEMQRLAAQRDKDRAEAIFSAFCKLIGHTKPKKVKQYSELRYSHDEPFRLDYSNTIQIDRRGMEILAAFFKIDEQQQEEPTNNVVNLT